MLDCFATAVFKGHRGALTISGGYGEGETPLPIPNRAVKPLSADGTWLARARESRTPPVYMQSRAALRGGSWRLRIPVVEDVEDVARRPADEEAAHTPRLVGQRVHDLAAEPLTGGQGGVD